MGEYWAALGKRIPVLVRHCPRFPSPGILALSETDVSGWRSREQKEGPHESPGKPRRAGTALEPALTEGTCARPRRQVALRGSLPAARQSRRVPAAAAAALARWALLCGSGRK